MKKMEATKINYPKNHGGPCEKEGFGMVFFRRFLLDLQSPPGTWDPMILRVVVNWCVGILQGIPQYPNPQPPRASLWKSSPHQLKPPTKTISSWEKKILRQGVSVAAQVLFLFFQSFLSYRMGFEALYMMGCFFNRVFYYLKLVE